MKRSKIILLFVSIFFSGFTFSQNKWGINAMVPGNVGIGISPPNYQCHVNALYPGNQNGWMAGPVLSNTAALYWEGSTVNGSHYFMAYPSVTPAGDFYQGYASGVISNTAVVNYSSKVFVLSTSAWNYVPVNSTQFFKNVIVADAGTPTQTGIPSVYRFLGVNTFDPKRVANFMHSSLPQLRLTQTQNTSATSEIYADFQVSSAGHLNIQPMNGTNTRSVGIDVASPTEKIDVNGNARLRNVPVLATNNCLITGITQSGGVQDVKLNRLQFTGSTSDVLLGNGTWGPAPSLVSADNGLTMNGSIVELGQTWFLLGDPGKLLGHREIPMANNMLLFHGQGISGSQNSFGIGYEPTGVGYTIPAKFSVLQQNPANTTVSTIAGSFINRDLMNTSFTGEIIGVNGISDASNTGGNINNVGGEFYGTGAQNNYGVKGIANGGATSYAVYGQNTGTSPSHWAGYFQGDVNIAGQAFCTASAWSSDKRFKQNIKSLENVTEKISRVKGYNYEYRTEEFKKQNFAKGKQIGFIAQELKEVFPELVIEGEGGYNYVNYIGMIPVLLEAIKEQQTQINELKSMVKNTSSTINSDDKVTAVNLSDVQAIVLEQNVPNPFAEQTTIGYTLTDGIQKAQILFYNVEGKLINSTELKVAPGKGQVNVFASDLTNGIYTYTLIVDGKVIESKRMVKNK